MLQAHGLLSRLLSSVGTLELLLKLWLWRVNSVPPPPPVAAPGPLRVELRLANGQCVTKGCAEGKYFVPCFPSVLSFWLNPSVVPQGMRPIRPTTVMLIIPSQKSCESLCMLRCALWRGLTPTLS